MLKTTGLGPTDGTQDGQRSLVSDGGHLAPASKEACFEAAWYMGELGFEFKRSPFLAVHLG